MKLTNVFLTTVLYFTVALFFLSVKLTPSCFLMNTWWHCNFLRNSCLNTLLGNEKKQCSVHPINIKSSSHYNPMSIWIGWCMPYFSFIGCSRSFGYKLVFETFRIEWIIVSQEQQRWKSLLTSKPALLRAGF